MKILKFALGFILGLLILILPLSQFQPNLLEPLQSMAVQLDGRKKPLDTVALETVEKLHGSASYKQADGSKLSYLETYLAIAFNDRDWNTEPFVLLSYRPLKEAAGFDPEQKHFSFREIIGSPALTAIVKDAHAKQLAEQELSRLEREALTIEERVALLYRTVGDNSLPLVPHPSDGKGTWVTINQATELYSPEDAAPVMALQQQIEQTYRLGPAHRDIVGKLAADLKQTLASFSPAVYPSDQVLQREVFFNGFHPFGKAWMIYGLGFLVMLVSLWFKPTELYWGAMGLFCSGMAVQAYGFLLRMQIADRPPVTNMYESVIWVSFGVTAIALLFEFFSNKARYFLLAAAPLAVVCLVLADRLPVVLDPSIAPLVPVLRDNFWLSIHVPTITLGYAAFALAMGLGHVSLGHYLFAKPDQNPAVKKRIQTLSQFNYRTLQVGVLLLTTGIILGGIWAHFSWGRFWGWDPKETWALIALLCYLVPLHGRLVGWIGNFGINVASVVSFNAVLMAWYGVNFVLGTGLHSYGFGTGDSQMIVATVVAADLGFVLLTALRHVRPGLNSEASETISSEPSAAPVTAEPKSA